MKCKLFHLTIVLLLLCWLSTLATVAAAQQPISPADVNGPFAGASISDFKGRVRVQLPNQVSAGPARGETLPAGTVITTEEGGMLLRLVDGSEVIVRSHTSLVLKQPSGNDWRYLQLIIGRIRTAVQKRLGGASGFQIGTPSAVISVRGTRFDVEVNRQSITEVDVEEGVVRLEGVHGIGMPVEITAGMSSRVGLDAGPETPRPTEELRPEVERPEGKEKEKEFERNPGDLIEKLRSEERERQKDRDMEEKHGSEPGSEKLQEPEPSDPHDSALLERSGDRLKRKLVFVATIPSIKPVSSSFQLRRVQATHKWVRYTQSKSSIDSFLTENTALRERSALASELL